MKMIRIVIIVRRGSGRAREKGGKREDREKGERRQKEQDTSLTLPSLINAVFDFINK